VLRDRNSTMSRQIHLIAAPPNQRDMLGREIHTHGVLTFVRRQRPDRVGMGQTLWTGQSLTAQVVPGSRLLNLVAPALDTWWPGEFL
jgi:hypothetical protein